jgi:hypothetical protein
MSKMKNIRNEIENILRSIPIDFGGGCSVSKATVLAYIIKNQHIKKSIDIGIYRGRSFFPQAYMHTHYTGGQVYGIDPYKSEEALEHDHVGLQNEIKDFVNNTDFDELYTSVNNMRSSLGVKPGSKIIRKTSNDAAVSLKRDGEAFGLIHLDGNHDTVAVINDVNNYLPMLDPNNGFLVLDDISWNSVKPAVELVSKTLTLLYARVDTQNDYAVFWTGKSKIKKSLLRCRIATAAEG